MQRLLCTHNFAHLMLLINSLGSLTSKNAKFVM